MKTLFPGDVALIAGSLCILAACSSKHENLLRDIKKAEEVLAADSTRAVPDEGKASTLVHLYEQFAVEFPDDTASPGYLFRAAKLSLSQAKYDRAISLFDKVYTKYTDYPRRPDCLFMQGFVYDDNLKNLDAARKKYEEFLRVYPKHELAQSAEFLLANLGKSDEELIRELEAKAAQQDSLPAGSN